jgi:hypothetical protein
MTAKDNLKGRSIKITLLFLLFIIILVPAAYSQTSVPKEQILSELQSLRVAILETNSTDNDFRTYQNQCRTMISGARVLIDSHDNSFPLVYLESLQSLTHLANQMVSAGPAEQNKFIRLILTDLSLKFKTSENDLAPGQLVSLINVTVAVTKSNGKPAMNLRVKYCPIGYDPDYQHPTHIFITLTSPAYDELAPGIYYLWLSEDGETQALRQIQVVIDPAKHDHTIQINLR